MCCPQKNWNLAFAGLYFKLREIPILVRGDGSGVFSCAGDEVCKEYTTWRIIE